MEKTRKRIKRVQFASSSNMENVLKHREELQENYNKNQALFLMINQTVTAKKKTSLQLFEEGLKEKLQQFKQQRNERK